MMDTIKSKYDRFGPFPPIFSSLPMRVYDIKVVLYYNSMPYGERPDSIAKCLLTRALAQELKKVPMTIVPRKIQDFRMWQERGILHLSEQEYSQRDIYFMIRWLALYRKDIVFVFVDNEAHLKVKFFMDSSDESNIFVSSPTMKGSNLFKILHEGLKARGLKTINWSCV